MKTKHKNKKNDQPGDRRDKSQKRVASGSGDLIEQLEQENKDLRGKITELGTIIDQVEDEKLEVINKLKKALADYDNLEKSSQKRMNIQMDHLRAGVAEEVITILDDVDMAVKTKANGMIDFTEEAEKWVDGILNVFEKLKRTLEKFGVVEMEVNVGDQFDSKLHEAITVVEQGKNGKDGEIVDILKKGYVFEDGRVARSAKVIVGKVSKK